MSRLTLLLYLFGLAWSQVSAALDAEAIVGGEYADEDDIKYQIALQVEGDLECGGCIIDDNYVLTAAHCVTDKTGQFKLVPYRVVAGTKNLVTMKNAVVVGVDTIYIPKKYHSVYGFHDIAILKLKTRLGLCSNPHIQKLNLPQAYNSYIGETAIVSGFGWQNMNTNKKPGGTTDDKLKYAYVKVLSYEECSYDPVTKKKVPQHVEFQNFLCGRVFQRNIDKPEGICYGDSGGPLVYGDEIISISTSSPHSCDESITPASYIRVYSYVGLIKSVINGTPSSELVSAKICL